MTTEDLLNKLITTKSNLKTAIQNAYNVNLSKVTFENYHTYIKKVTCPGYITPYITIGDPFDSRNGSTTYIYFEWKTNCPYEWSELCWVNADTKEEYTLDEDAQGEKLTHKCNNRGTIKLYAKWTKDKVTVISNTVTVTDV